MTPTLVAQRMDQVGVSESRKIVSVWQQQQMAAAMPSNGTP